MNLDLEVAVADALMLHHLFNLQKVTERRYEDTDLVYKQRYLISPFILPTAKEQKSYVNHFFTLYNRPLIVGEERPAPHPSILTFETAWLALGLKETDRMDLDLDYRDDMHIDINRGDDSSWRDNMENISWGVKDEPI